MNKVILMGRLTTDPDMKYTSSNIAVVRYTLAVNRPGKQQEGQPTADFINIISWRNTAEFAGKYFRKGMQVLVEGRIHNNNWTDKEGQKRFGYEITADQCYFADSKRTDSEPSHAEQQQHESGDTAGEGFYTINQDDPDLPF